MSNNPYLHEEVYRGKDFLKKLGSEKIAVCGVGALGSILVDTLIRQGFTNISIIDFDRVEVHNLNTQIYGYDDVGKLKVGALQQKMYRATKIMVETFDKKLDSSNIQKILKNHTIVVDTFDNSVSRKLIFDYSKSTKTNAIHAGMIEGYGEVVWNENYRVPNDPPKGSALDICDYPLGRNLITLTVSVLAEELQQFVLTQKKSTGYSITLGDLRIKAYK